MDHEIGAHCEHAGLQHHAQHLGNGAEATTEIARLLLTPHILPIGLAPARGDMAGHSHGNQCLSVAPARFREAIACDSSLRCRPCGRAHEDLGQQGQHNENDRSGQRCETDERMEGEANREIQRDPGQVEQGHGAESGEIGPHGIEVAQGLSAITASADPQRQTHQGIVDSSAQGFVERAADAHEDASANCIENTQGREQCRGENQKADQCGHAPARQHAVIDFQHEHGAGEHQNVAHAADQCGAIEGPAARGKRFREFRANRRTISFRWSTLHRLAPDEAQGAGVIAGQPRIAEFRRPMVRLCHEYRNLSPALPRQS